jgi:hypothetical protein
MPSRQPHSFRPHSFPLSIFCVYRVPARCKILSSFIVYGRKTSNGAMPYSDYWEDIPGDELPSDLWDSPSPGESLTLPPITNSNYDDLTSFNDAQYFDALPRLPSPDPFGGEPSSNSNSQTTNEPPPSNQQARRHPPPAISQYRVAGSESPDPFEDFIDLTPPPEMGNTRSRNTTRASSVVDLTESSPAKTNSNSNDMAPNLRKRKASSTPGEGRATKTARASPRRKVSIGDVTVVDLSNVEDEAQYEAMKKKEQEEAIRKQNEEEANRPVKLAEFQCIICMDNPTDLTVTHCGMSSFFIFIPQDLLRGLIRCDIFRPPLLLGMSPSSPLRWR